MKKTIKIIVCTLLIVFILPSSFAIRANAMPAATVEDVFRWDDYLAEINYMLSAPKTEFTKAEAVYLAAVFKAKGIHFKDSATAFSIVEDYWNNQVEKDSNPLLPPSGLIPVESLRQCIKKGRYEEATNSVLCDVPQGIWQGEHSVGEYAYDNYGQYAGQSDVQIGDGFQGSTDPVDYPGMPSNAVVIGTCFFSEIYNDIVYLGVRYGEIESVFYPQVYAYYYKFNNGELKETSIVSTDFFNCYGLEYVFYYYNSEIWFYTGRMSNITGNFVYTTNFFERVSPSYLTDHDLSSSSNLIISVGESVGNPNESTWAPGGKMSVVRIPLSNTSTSQNFFDISSDELKGQRETEYSESWEEIASDLFPDDPIGEYGLNPIKDNFDLLLNLIDRKLGYIPSNLKAVFDELGTIEPARIPSFDIIIAGKTHRVVNNEYLNDEILPTTRVWFEGIFWIFYSLYLWRQIIVLLRGIDPSGPFGHKNVGGGGKSSKEGKGD